MKNKLLNLNNLSLQDLSESELHIISGGVDAEGVGYAIGWTIGVVFGTVVNAVKLFTGNLK